MSKSSHCSKRCKLQRNREKRLKVQVTDLLEAVALNALIAIEGLLV